jgi:PPP family 3-phenylpropionic acid transporter
MHEHSSSSRAIWAGKGAYFCYFAAMAGFMPFLALYYRQLGLDGQAIGLLMSLSPVVMLIAAPLWGALADATQQHRRLLFLTISAALLVVAGFLVATTLYQLIAIVILYALVTAPITPLLDNSVNEQLGAQRQRYGRVRLWGAIGWGIVATIGGIVVDQFGLQASFITYFVFMGALLIAAAYLPITQASIGNRFWQGARSLFADWQWSVLLIAAFSSGVAMSVTNNFLFLHLDALGASTLLMGFGLTTATLSELPIFFFADRLLKRWGARRLLIVALVAQIVRLLAYALMPAPWFILPINLLHGLTFSALWSAGVAYAAALAAPKGMGTTAQGMLTGVTMGLSGLVGGLLGGWIYEHFGAVILFTSAGMGVVAGLLFFLVAGQKAVEAERVEQGVAG